MAWTHTEKEEKVNISQYTQRGRPVSLDWFRALPRNPKGKKQGDGSLCEPSPITKMGILSVKVKTAARSPMANLDPPKCPTEGRDLKDPP